MKDSAALSESGETTSHFDCWSHFILHFKDFNALSNYIIYNIKYVSQKCDFKDFSALSNYIIYFIKYVSKKCDFLSRKLQK